MKPSRHWSSVLSDLILVTGLVLAWAAFAPVKVGGQAAYVLVNGISMEPNYHTGDLVVTRQAQAYQIGDVVAYIDAEMEAHVIHRIIGIEQDRYVLKGDNNFWIDAYRPTQAEIIGKQWLHAPQAGRAMQWLRSPLNLSISVILLGGMLMTSLFNQPAQGKKGKKKSALQAGSALEGVFYLLGILALGFLGLAILAFLRPSTRNADNILYQQDGNYFYSAAGTPGVYDTEMVRSGEPVFPRLTCFLNVGFIYNLLGNQLQDISGTSQMAARVLDEQSGWQRTLPMNQQATFNGNTYFTMTTLDLCQVESLINMVEQETGLRANTYSVEIVTDIAFTANAPGQVVTDGFSPVLAFKFDKVHLYLANVNGTDDPMHSTQQGSAINSSLESNTLPILGWEPTIGFLRVFSLTGLSLSLCALGALGWSLFKTARQSEEALIRLRYAPLLMDVYERSLDVTLPVIDVTSIDDLARLAERQNTMILHMTLNFLHYYLVQGSGALYRYVLSSGRRGVEAQDAGEPPIIEHLARFGEYQQAMRQPIPQEARADTIDVEAYTPAGAVPTETQMLKKIKI